MNSDYRAGCAVILVLIGFSFCIAGMISDIGFLGWLFAVACLLGSIPIFASANEKAKEEERQAKKQQEEEQKERAKMRKRMVREGTEITIINALKAELSTRLDGDLIIDTCALMDCETSAGKNVFNALKTVCLENKSKIIILPEVFEELTKHRKGNNSEKSIQAQAAKRLLLDFQKCHIMQSPEGAYGFPNQSQSFYADKAIAKYMLECFKKGRKAYLITADVDLTIRIINILENEKLIPPERTIASLKDLFQAAADQKGFSDIVQNGLVHYVETTYDPYGYETQTFYDI